MGSRQRAQSPSSVNKTSQWQLACVFRKHTSAFRFGAEPFCLCSRWRQCLQTASVLPLRCSSSNCGRAATYPGHFNTLFSKRAISKRAPQAMGIFLKMASCSCVSGCGRFLASSDGHDRCVLCLGYKHTEAALVDESCSHCGNMTIAMLWSRYLLDKWGGIPLAMPRSSSSVSRKATSAHGQGDLRIMVRASPSSTFQKELYPDKTNKIRNTIFVHFYFLFFSTVLAAKC